MDFTRDFGYLDKFLVNMAKHADTLPAASGARLRSLMAEETQRWNEVKALLAGGEPAAGSAPVPVAVPPTKAEPAAAANPVPVAPTGLTVGSLYGSAKT